LTINETGVRRRHARKNDILGTFIAVDIELIILALNLLGLINSLITYGSLFIISAVFAIILALKASYSMIIPSISSFIFGVILFADAAFSSTNTIFGKLIGVGTVIFIAVAISSSILIGVFTKVAASATLEKRYTGAESLIGKTAISRTILDPAGWVSVEGIQWRATSRSGAIQAGRPVRIVDLKGLTLIVEPL